MPLQTLLPAKALLNWFLSLTCPTATRVLVTDVPILAPITMGMAECTSKTEIHNT